ncbi:MAG TPA: STT3 domain-containing protein [Candidatus Thermoplasmatota archaeon]|nr:STT3 domain-containing protein [Candidatus Thermoplasmatota archaeon]
MARDRAFWLTALGLVGIVLFAFFVRTYWNIDAASPGETFVLSESDAYYEHHTVERIQQEGWQQPIQDPLVNYPVGGINPNPPLWEWWIATWGALLTPFFGGDAQNHAVACPADALPSQATCVSTWWVTVASPAVFGAVTVLLVVLIGRELWDIRAGLLAGFLAATSTSHIERSVLGFADHDSFVLFFIVLAFYFYLKSLHASRENRWVQRWGDMAQVKEGLASYWRANQLSLAYAAMAGLAIAGVGLAWKGYAYAAGTLFVFGIVQVLVSHWRQRDATHIFATIALALLVAVVASAPYYGNSALGAVLDTLLPVLFILFAWVVFGLVFTATRDLPFVLVLPAAILAGLASLAVAFVVAPSVAQTLLGPLVYFKQTKLYTTIAEAHPADFNTVVFGTGLVGFFIAMFALPYLVWVNRKTWRPAWTFVAVWAIIAFFMTQSAVRFMFNATPVFALLGGWGTGMLVARLRFEAIGKNLAGLGGVSRDALKRAVNAWHIVGAILLAVLLIMPNVIFAVDAGMPAEYEDKLVKDELSAKGLPDNAQNRDETFVGHQFGAFGQGFISDYWRVLFEWLATQDAQVPPEQRPAFLSWWDYGHWALSLGHHPAVADNFQNGFQFAGDFIVAQNETHAIQLFIARLGEAARSKGESLAPFTQALQAQGLNAADAQLALDTMMDYGNADGAHGFTPSLTLDQSAAALHQIEAATGEKIRYFAMDVRLFPYDNPDPSSPNIDFGSIFYAPVVLSDHDPNDFVEAIVKTEPRVAGKNEFTQDEFAGLQRDPNILPQLGNVRISQVYRYREPFFNSMFYRAYIGTPVNTNTVPPTSCDYPAVDFGVQQGNTLPGLEGNSLPGLPMPAFCMQHFRIVYYNPQVRMIKYYPGAVVQGKVLVDGKPLEGARVVVYDDAGDMLFQESQGLLSEQFKNLFRTQHGRDVGVRDFDVPHAVATTGPDGSYTLLAPFSTTGQVTVRAFKDEAELGNRSLTISVADAESGRVFDATQATIDSTSGSLQGTVFFDADRNGRFGEGDLPLQGAKVTVRDAGDATSDAGGNYTIPNLPPGSHQLVAVLADYDMRQQDAAVLVRPGQPTTYDIAMQLHKAAIAGFVWRDANADGSRGADEGVQSVSTKAVPDFRVSPTTALQETYITRDANGTLAFQATPGRYVFNGQWRNPADGSDWAFGSVLDVAKGQEAVNLADNTTALRPATLVDVNLTLEKEPGNVTQAGSAQVLLIPTQGGAPSAERLAVNGTLNIALVPGSYQVYATLQSDGATYRLEPPGLLVVNAGAPTTFQGQLTKP